MFISETIRRDTRAALLAFAADEKNNAVIPDVPRDGSWLIYERCCIQCHPLHGFANLRFFDHLPAVLSPRAKVYTLSQTGTAEGRGGKCEEIQKIRDSYLAARGVQVVRLEPRSKFEDFARLVFSEKVLIPSGGSSWVLWVGLVSLHSLVGCRTLASRLTTLAPRLSPLTHDRHLATHGS